MEQVGRPRPVYLPHLSADTASQLVLMSGFNKFGIQSRKMCSITFPPTTLLCQQRQYEKTDGGESNLETI